MFSNIILFICFCVQALGDLIILYPKQNQTFNAENNLTIPLMLINDITYPSLDQYDNITVSLCTGPNDNITLIETIANLTIEDFNTEGSEGSQNWQYNLILNNDITSDGLYYLQLVSVYGDFYNIHYSTRFNLAKMKNHTLINHGTIEDAPSPVTIQKGIQSSSFSVDTASYTVPPELQTGTVKYAPMQPLIGSVWKSERWSDNLKKTSIKVFKSLGTQGNVEFTVTQPPTYTLVSGVNSHTGISTVQEWYDPKKRVQKPVLRTHHH